MAYSSNNNAVLFSNCNNLENLTVLVEIGTAIGSGNNRGWSLQLNSYPPSGHFCQTSEVNWFQYIVLVADGVLQYYIQYWSLGSSLPWPSGYTPIPGTTPWLPCWAHDFANSTTFATGLNGDTLPSGSFLQIALGTDANGGVTTATFTYVDPNGVTQTGVFVAPVVHPINGFQLNFSGYPGSNTVFAPSTPVGLIRYSISSGELALLSDAADSACVGVSTTGELSNMAYSDISGAPGATVTQTLLQPITGVGPAALTFPTQQVGTQSLPQTVTVAVGAGVTVTGISLFSISPGTPQFACEPPLGPLNVQNGLFNISVWYRPTVSGPCTAQLEIGYDTAGSPLVVGLSATGVAPHLTASPQSLLFTTTKITNHTVTLTNSGTAPLTISSIAIHGASGFTLTTSCNVGAGVLSLNPAQQCTITVAFHGVVDTEASLQIVHNAAGSPTTINLQAQVKKSPGR